MVQEKGEQSDRYAEDQGLYGRQCRRAYIALVWVCFFGVQRANEKERWRCAVATHVPHEVLSSTISTMLTTSFGVMPAEAQHTAAAKRVPTRFIASLQSTGVGRFVAEIKIQGRPRCKKRQKSNSSTYTIDTSYIHD